MHTWTFLVSVIVDSEIPPRLLNIFRKMTNQRSVSLKLHGLNAAAYFATFIMEIEKINKYDSYVYNEYNFCIYKPNEVTITTTIYDQLHMLVISFMYKHIDIYSFVTCHHKISLN